MTDPQETEIAKLIETIRRLRRIHVDGRWTRVLRSDLLVKAPPGLSSPDVLWAGGTLLASSRFVPKGLCAALHLADSSTTAMAENARLAVPTASPVFETLEKSITLIPVDVDVREVLDLTDENVLRDVGVGEAAQLTALDLDFQAVLRFGAGAMSLPKRLGIAAFRSGAVVALKSFSARRPTGTNLVVFEERLRSLKAGTLTATHPLTNAPVRKP